MPNKIPFLKIYCTAELRDLVVELARLNRRPASRFLREYLDTDRLEQELMIARSREAERLAGLQRAETSRLGQADWITNAGEGAPPGRAERKRSDRPRARVSRDAKKKRTRGAVKPQGKRKSGGR